MREIGRRRSERGRAVEERRTSAKACGWAGVGLILTVLSAVATYQGLGGSGSGEGGDGAAGGERRLRAFRRELATGDIIFIPPPVGLYE